MNCDLCHQDLGVARISTNNKFSSCLDCEIIYYLDEQLKMRVTFKNIDYSFQEWRRMLKLKAFW